MSQSFVLSAATVLALALAACGRRPPQGAEAAAHAADAPQPVAAALAPQAPQTPNVQDFVARAAAGDALELDAAQVAAQRGRHPAVKGFAAMMIRDHGDSADLLRKAVGESGETLALAAGPSAEQQAQLAELRSAPEAGFDKAYLESQVQAHERALALMQGYAQAGDNPSLRAFAGQAAGRVQQHLQLAESLAEQLP